jgi:hypothetical protein
LGGHFAPENDGQFTPESGGHFETKRGGQIERNLHILGNNTNLVGIGLSDDLYHFGPRWKLEINADLTTTESGQSKGSGLQFRQLDSGSQENGDTYYKPYGRVLTVDSEGKVKYTEGGGVPFGDCTIGEPGLLTDRALAFTDVSIYYDGNNVTSGISNDVTNSIGIGYACGDPLRGKLSVYQYASLLDGEETTAGYFQNQSDEYGGGAYKRGIWAVSNGYSDNQFNIGGDFFADSSTTINFGVQGTAGEGTKDYYVGQNIGGQFTSDYADYENIGVVAIASNTFSTASHNYGIFAVSPHGGCTNPICYNAAGYFQGDIFYFGNAYTPSDSHLKDNIQSIQNPMSIIEAFEPKTYDFKTNQYPYLNLPEGQQAGLLAQDVESIIPELVKDIAVPSISLPSANYDNSGAGQTFKAINYIGIIPYLIGAVKQQQKNIDSLSNLIAEAQVQINNCCRSGDRRNEERGSTEGTQDNNDGSATIEVELSDVKTIILDQNTPNPFSEETFISYVIPNTVSKAQIMIFDKVGNVLRTVEIHERGEGMLHVYSENLSSGVYSYSLVADGITIDTKKMVCEK